MTNPWRCVLVFDCDQFADTTFMEIVESAGQFGYGIWSPGPLQAGLRQITGMSLDGLDDLKLAGPEEVRQILYSRGGTIVFWKYLGNEWYGGFFLEVCPGRGEISFRSIHNSQESDDEGDPLARDVQDILDAVCPRLEPKYGYYCRGDQVAYGSIEARENNLAGLFRHVASRDQPVGPHL